MKKLVVVLGFVGLMVRAAQAGDRWPAAVCSEIARVRTVIEVDITSPARRAQGRLALLILQEMHCGIDTRPLQAADIALLDRGRTAPRAPVLCDTTPKANGGSYTDCF
jgi:hypothetical protein